MVLNERGCLKTTKRDQISGDVQNNVKTTCQRRTRCQQGSSQNTASLSDHGFEPTQEKHCKIETIIIITSTRCLKSQNKNG